MFHTLSPKIKYGVGLLLILLLVGGGFLYREYLNRNVSLPLENGGLVTEVEGLPEGATAEVVDRVNAELFEKTPRPSLVRDFPSGGLPSDAYALLKEKRQTVVSVIEANPASLSQWISLGILHKQVGDYEGARIYWNYVATVNPQYIAVHWDLATLYKNYLKDTAQAENEFKKVLALDSHVIDAYRELADMYHSMGADDKALSIISQGLVQNPGNLDLLIARAHLYRDMKKVTEARSAYDAAIAQAKKENKTSLVTELATEKNAL